jgi:hypothetical protein
MKLTISIKIFLLVSFFLLFSNLELTGQEARLENIIVTNTNDDLLINLNVEGAFTDKMKSAVLSGVPITFSFFIDLFKARNYWADKKIVEQKITHSMKYHTLKKEFLIQRSWESGKSITTGSFTEAQQLMTQINGLRIIQLNELIKGSQYQIRIKAELAKKTLPLYLHYVIFFIALWDFETDWYTIDFIY